jgi:ABC-type transport system involved in multi-copper enzyme maturation permease subunit
MNAELLKVRFLPTPRNATLGIVAALIAACVITLLIGPDQGSSAWHKAPETVGSLTVTIGAMVLGAWMIGLEFASNTVRLAATVQPDRLRLIFTKLVATKLLLFGFAVVTLGVTFAASALMSNIGASSFETSNTLETFAGNLITAVLWGLLAFGFALLVQSYTGGVVAVIVLALGLDSALQLIPTVGPYTFGAATASISNAITGEATDLKLWQAILAAAGWLLVIIGVASARFAKRDLK